MSPRFRQRFHILYLLVGLNILFFIIVYHRLILITPSKVPSIDFILPSILSNTDIESNTATSAICYIPRFDPWDQTIAKLIRIKPIYRCPINKRSLIDVMNYTQLAINQTVNRTLFFSTITHCIYMKIGRNPEEPLFRDWSYTLSEPILIRNGRTESILDADFVLTRCYNNRSIHFNGSKFCGNKCSSLAKTTPAPNATTEKKTVVSEKNRHLVYEYVHPLMHLKRPAFSRENWLRQQPRTWLSKLFSSSSSSHTPPSVIIIILDAVSDLQARRALPQTMAYLKSRGLLTFQRHAIVGDGTFDNIVPMLFGQPASDLQEPNTNDSRYEFPRTEWKIDPTTKKRIPIKKIVHYPGPYDSYPFIMRNFSQFNYTTFFSEEWRESAFYNLKNGFRQSPADFYLRPYWLALYETMSYNKYGGNSNPKPCYLNKLLHHLSLHWLEQFLSIHHTSNRPTFGILKLNEMSHDYLERLFWIDYDLKTYFEDLFDRDLLNNTIFIFCGDHGHRQHRIRLTRIGSFEVKLPFFSMLLPDLFKQNFPQAVQNLIKNRERLTSWWDVYETLANIVKMVEQPHVFDPLLVNWQPTTSGISMFHPIPDRNCSWAGIPEKYCPCSRSISLDNTLPIVKELALFSINYINTVKLKNHTHLCVLLELKKIFRAEVEELSRTKKSTKSSSTGNFTHSYTVLFETAPSGGTFESRLLYDQATKTIQIHSDLLRINLYGQSSQCIQDKYDLRSFCYCISYHNKLTGSTISTATNQTSTMANNSTGSVISTSTNRTSTKANNFTGSTTSTSTNRTSTKATNSTVTKMNNITDTRRQ